MRIANDINHHPISDNAMTILETDDGNTVALFTDRTDYIPVGRTTLRFNDDEEHELRVPIESLRDVAEAIVRHADYLDATSGAPASLSF